VARSTSPITPVDILSLGGAVGRDLAHVRLVRGGIVAPISGAGRAFAMPLLMLVASVALVVGILIGARAARTDP
jgi:hypothetical protein